ncbi:MAG: hypothetical protein ACO3JG_00475 [Luteolibacter sp.]
MKSTTMSLLCGVLMIAAIAMPTIRAASRAAAHEAPANDAVQALEARYSARLEALRSEISKAIPAVADGKKAAYATAREAEKAAKAALDAAVARAGELQEAEALVAHAKGKWIGGAETAIAAAKDKLAKAGTDAERKAAQEELAKHQDGLKAGQEALVERQAALDKAKRERPQVEKEMAAAQQAHEQAIDATIQAVGGLGLDPMLASDKLDVRLAEYVILSTATPRGMAEFAARGDQQQKRVSQLLADGGLMVQTVAADGAMGGRYGEAMEIYTAILKASDKAREGVLQRLAVATALEHAFPIKQRNPAAVTDGPEHVDPVKRYLHFEKAFLDGDLDPAFKGLSAWDYRMVVNGEETEEVLTWGRQMLRNYRPDHITTSDYNWRYVAIVRSDVRYGSQDNQYDEDRLHFFQNILKNGGVCGRRAFIGRFILRAFGIPTTARPQRAHAALTHWTPDGWVICLGGGWGVGWLNDPTRGRISDLDFLAMTQARMTGEPYMQVLRAQWIGDVMGEARSFGFLTGDPAFWNGVALYTQRKIIREADAKTLAAVGTDIGEANETKEKVEIAKVTLSAEDLAIAIAANGVITIPAAACSKPTESTGKILFMPSVLGGKQLHYNRNGAPEDFEYTFDAPKAGKYALTARVVTPSWKQRLTVKANGSNPVDIALPFTVGMWDQTEPVEITLQQGSNVLTFSREQDDRLKGITIRDFTLTPVK